MGWKLKMSKEKACKIKNIKYTALIWLPVLLILPILSPIRPLTFEKNPSNNFKSFAQNDNLQAETDALLPLFDEMPPVPVFLRDEPVLKSGTSIESGVAYTNCENHDNPTIFIKKIFYEKTNRKQLVNILKHELTHAWLCRQNLMSGHDERFQRKFTAVGGFGN
jgi:hypothetical protein